MAQRKLRAQSKEAVQKRQLKVGLINGRLNPLPPAWKPTSMTCLQLIQNWFIANRRDNIPPLCALDSKMVMHLKLNKCRNQMACFMRIVEKMAREKDCWVERRSDWDCQSLNSMWETIKPDFAAKFCQTKRKKEMTWKTAYNKMSEQNVFGNKRNKISGVAK